MPMWLQNSKQKVQTRGYRTNTYIQPFDRDGIIHVGFSDADSKATVEMKYNGSDVRELAQRTTPALSVAAVPGRG